MTRRLFDIWPANSAFLFNSENTSFLKWGDGSTNGLLKPSIPTALGRSRSNKRLIEIRYLSLFYLLSPTDFTDPLYLCVILQII